MSPTCRKIFKRRWLRRYRNIPFTYTVASDKIRDVVLLAKAFSKLDNQSPGTEMSNLIERLQLVHARHARGIRSKFSTIVPASDSVERLPCHSCRGTKKKDNELPVH